MCPPAQFSQAFFTQYNQVGLGLARGGHLSARTAAMQRPHHPPSCSCPHALLLSPPLPLTPPPLITQPITPTQHHPSPPSQRPSNYPGTQQATVDPNTASYTLTDVVHTVSSTILPGYGGWVMRGVCCLHSPVCVAHKLL